MNKKIGIILIIAALFSILLFQGIDTTMETTKYNVESKEIKNPIKIALVTDLHSCYYGENQKVLVNAIEKENPDVVLLGGDIVDDVLDRNNSYVFMKQISKKYPTYYVSGNHEYWSGDITTIIKDINSFNITVLSGDTVHLKFRNTNINLHGIDDYSQNGDYTQSYPLYNNQSWEEQFKRCENSTSKNDYDILLTHRPEFTLKYKNSKFDIILAGHAHGGQWRIPYILNGLLAPDQGFFPKYAGGLYEFENNSMVVSRGLSRESTQIPRFYNKPELVIVNLNPKL